MVSTGLIKCIMEATCRCYAKLKFNSGICGIGAGLSRVNTGWTTKFSR